MNKEK